MGSAVSLGINLLASIAYARMLGVEEFGVYATVLAFKSTFAILASLGQNQATTVFFAEQYAKKDMARLQGVLRYYIVVNLAAIVILAVLAAIAPLIAIYVYGDARIGSIARIGFLVIMAGSFHRIFFIIIQTTRRITLLAVLENISIFLSLFCTIILLFLGFGVYGIFVGMLVSNLLMQAILYGTYIYIRPTLHIPTIRDCMHAKTKIAPLFRQGIAISIDKNLTNIFLPISLFLLSIFAPTSIVGIARLSYNIGLLPASLLLKDANKMASTVLPALHAKSFRILRLHTLQLLKHATVIHVAMSAASIIILPYIVVLLYGETYAAVTTPMVLIILFATLRSVHIANSTLLRLYKKAYVGALWQTTILAVNTTIFVFTLQILPPLTAFIITVGIYFMSPLYINWYLYRLLLATNRSQTAAA
jgi:O-antigen/teichoic acid export membrane protein